MSIFKVADHLTAKSFIGIMFDGLDITSMPDATIPDNGYIGTYIDPNGELVALALCDLNISAHTACALTMFPATASQEAITTGSLDENLMGNLGELLNIYSRFFMDDNTPHLKLDKVVHCNDLSDEGKALIASDAERTTLKFNLSDYGDGLITLIAK